jgi:hypothetical protein
VAAQVPKGKVHCAALFVGDVAATGENTTIQPHTEKITKLRRITAISRK